MMNLIGNCLASLVIACLFAVVVGCGGSPKTERGSTGRVVLNISWPTTRDIPAATRSIKVVAKVLEPPNGPQVGEVVVPRPENATSSQAVLDNIPSVKVKITATAHASNDGTGAAIASGSVDVTVIENSTVSPNIDLGPASDVQSVFFEDEAFIAIGHNSTFYAFARNVSGQIVDVDPTEWEWQVTGTATVTPSGQTALLRGTAEGQATVTLRHVPSDKSSQRNFVVAACSEYTTSPPGLGAGGTTLNVTTYESSASATGRFEFIVEAPTLTGTAGGTIEFRAYIEDETLNNPTPGTASASASWPGGSDSVSGAPTTVTRLHPITLQHGQRITITANASVSAGTEIGISAGVTVNFVNNPAGVNVRLLQCPD